MSEFLSDRSQVVMWSIQTRDPDGWEHREPTDADYAAFKRWVVDAYGPAMLDVYMSGGLGSAPDWF